MARYGYDGLCGLVQPALLRVPIVIGKQEAKICQLRPVFGFTNQRSRSLAIRNGGFKLTLLLPLHSGTLDTPGILKTESKRSPATRRAFKFKRRYTEVHPHVVCFEDFAYFYPGGGGTLSKVAATVRRKQGERRIQELLWSFVVDNYDSLNRVCAVCGLTVD